MYQVLHFGLTAASCSAFGRFVLGVIYSACLWFVNTPVMFLLHVLLFDNALAIFSVFDGFAWS